MDDLRDLGAMEATWGMPYWPKFQLFTHVVDPRLCVLMQVHRRGWAQVLVEWIAREYRGEEEQLLTDDTHWLAGRGTSADLENRRQWLLRGPDETIN